MEVSKYPPLTPWANTLFLCPLQRFCCLSFDSTDERYTWSSAFCDHSTIALSIAYMVHIRFVHYTSVTHTAKSVSWRVFVCYFSVTYSLLIRFMRSLHVPQRPLSPWRRLSSPDDPRINNFAFFLSVRPQLPLSVNM